MTEDHRVSGDNSAVDVEKPSPVYSSTPRDNSEMSTEKPPSPVPGDAPEEDSNCNELHRPPSGAPLDRVPSQAQKLGKKKIVAVMTALCVCTAAVWRDRPKIVANPSVLLVGRVPCCSRYGEFQQTCIHEVCLVCFVIHADLPDNHLDRSANYGGIFSRL